MFSTSMSKASSNIYFGDIGYLLRRGFESVTPDENKVIGHVKVYDDGNMLLAPKPFPGSFRSALVYPKDGGGRFNGGALARFDQTVESIGGSWKKVKVTHIENSDGSLRINAPAKRLPLDYGPLRQTTPKREGDGGSEIVKKAGESSILAAMPDGTSMLFDNLPMAEIIEVVTNLKQRGFQTS